jgi:hypothetical protein
VELAVQRWLRDRAHLGPAAALGLLQERYAIKAVPHREFPELVLLKYDQIESPFAEELVRDCRGLILNRDEDWRVVCMTYRKFFNHGETHAAEIHWPSARVYEKLDGSLIQLYFYKDKWRVATSGTPDAECRVGDFGITFRDLFWKVARNEGLRTGHLDTKFCYAFELCTQLNRVVVQHDVGRIYLHGARFLEDLQEINPMWVADAIGVREAPTLDLTNIEACVEAARHLDPLAHEGYVAVDGNYNRVKIKSPAYVALHHAKDGLLSRRMMANVIRRGEAEEMHTALEAFPELAVEFDRIRALHGSLTFDTQVHFGIIIRSLPTGWTRKDYALRATEDRRLAGALFHLLDKSGRDATGAVVPPENEDGIVQAYYANISERSYADLIGLKDAADPIRKENAA